MATIFTQGEVLTADKLNTALEEAASSGGGTGTGDVVGPEVAVDGNFASFGSTTGKLIKDSGVGASDFATAAQGTDARTPTTHGNDKHSAVYIVAADAVVPNAAITPATKTKITYDAKGLVTSGADATASDVGALPIGGGTMTGTLVSKASDTGTDRVYNIHVGASAPADTSMLFLDTSV